MGISGSLKDVSVADVMQFIHLGRRTGTLLLSRGGERAMIGFHGGRLVSAQAPHTPKLGDLLISSGMIDGGVLTAAIRSQNEELERRSLGQILVSSGSIDAQGLRQMIAEQIEQAVSEVMVWETGTFEFAIDDLRPIDDIALYPSDVLPDADINTQMVLLEAARIFDERNRDGTHPALPAGSPGSQASQRTRATAAVVLLRRRHLRRRRLDASDAERHGRRRGAAAAGPQPVDRARCGSTRCARLRPTPPSGCACRSSPRTSPSASSSPKPCRTRWRGRSWCRSIRPATPSRASRRRSCCSTCGGGASPSRRPGPLRRAYPRASFIALVEPGTPFARVYEVGMMAALPAEVEAVVACVENVIESRRDLVRGTPRPDTKSGVARLRRVFGDLRSGLISATVALNLMHIISESVERAVLFLVKRDHLVALGAFGSDPRGVRSPR